MAGRAGKLIYVYGVVQGVGFRPFAARLAEQLDIVGHVKNRGGYVELLAAPGAGGQESLRAFLHGLSACPLPGAAVLHVESAPCMVEAERFTILESSPDPGSPVMLPPDFAPCAACMAELADPQNRRAGHPFISCASCGPRYSILEAVPYDRAATTLSAFPLCPDCAAEYGARGDRRRCAQTICCPHCGPRLRFGKLTDQAALAAAADALRAGKLIAVKGVGGYHLAASPFDPAPLARLRSGKHREEKPFAVMFRDLDQVRAYCAVMDEEAELLASPARPIVLLPPAGRAVHPLVSRESAYLGAFLPSSAHQALLVGLTGPLVMTSANRSDAPIATCPDALQGLPLDGVLDHDRPIAAPLDDSVIRPTPQGPVFLRRARGYVPLPLRVPSAAPDSLALGGDLKAAFALRRGDWCYPSQHLGDLEDLANQELFRRQIEHMEKLLQIRPRQVLCDLHPGYASSALAPSFGLPVTRVQHHYAHILSVMGENGLDGPVIGVAMDGAGYGPDHAVWGFEFLLCTRKGYRRDGHLEYTPLQASDESMRNARRSAQCHLLPFGLAERVYPEDPALPLLAAAHRAGVNTLPTSSAGRLFDAAAAILGCGEYNPFEGACATKLEQLATGAADAPALPLPLAEQGDGFILSQGPLWEALTRLRENPPAAARGFHRALADGIVRGAEWMRARHSVSAVALGGGVFQNALLLSLTVPALEAKGFTVYRNQKLPPGDGGLSLGQLTYALDG